MRIGAEAESFRLAETFTISRGSRDEAQVLTATIEADGRTGRGECVPYARYGETMEGVAEAITSVSIPVTRAGLQEAMSPGAARNALDCALWDLEAKGQGRRVWAELPLARCVVHHADNPHAILGTKFSEIVD